MKLTSQLFRSAAVFSGSTGGAVLKSILTIGLAGGAALTGPVTAPFAAVMAAGGLFVAAANSLIDVLASRKTVYEREYYSEKHIKEIHETLSVILKNIVFLRDLILFSGIFLIFRNLELILSELLGSVQIDFAKLLLYMCIIFIVFLVYRPGSEYIYFKKISKSVKLLIELKNDLSAIREIPCAALKLAIEL